MNWIEMHPLQTQHFLIFRDIGPCEPPRTPKFTARHLRCFQARPGHPATSWVASSSRTCLWRKEANGATLHVLHIVDYISTRWCLSSEDSQNAASRYSSLETPTTHQQGWMLSHWTTWLLLLFQIRLGNPQDPPQRSANEGQNHCLLKIFFSVVFVASPQRSCLAFQQSSWAATSKSCLIMSNLPSSKTNYSSN